MFCLGNYIIKAAASTVNISNNTAGYALDEYNRGNERRQFGDMIRAIYQQKDATINGYCRFFDLTFSVINLMTGHDYSVPNVIREFNMSHGYGLNHADGYGVYHFISGSLPLCDGRVLCIDNYIKMRPREWDILKPGVRYNLVGVLQASPVPAVESYAYTR